jgi:hypothetical protein
MPDAALSTEIRANSEAAKNPFRMIKQAISRRSNSSIGDDKLQIPNHKTQIISNTQMNKFQPIENVLFEF